MKKDLNLRMSIVVAVYNSSASLNELMRRLEAVLKDSYAAFEVILVNDGSTDESWQMIEKLVAHHPFIRGINLTRNYGQHNALLCGIRAAKYDVIVTMDDDLQHPPEEIHTLIKKLTEGYDVVYGIPKRKQHGLWRAFASKLTTLALQSAMGVDIARNVSAFRAIRTQLRDAFNRYYGPFVSIDVLLTWGTASFAAVPVRHDPRRIGVSHYTLRKLISHALNMITGFSVLPLHLSSLIGICFTLFGMAVLVYVIGRYLIEGGSIPGFPFLASIIAIFSGAQLLTLGIFGEYLARIHFRTMERPPYVVRNDTSSVQE